MKPIVIWTEGPKAIVQCSSCTKIFNLSTTDRKNCFKQDNVLFAKCPKCGGVIAIQESV